MNCSGSIKVLATAIAGAWLVACGGSPTFVQPPGRVAADTSPDRISGAATAKAGVRLYVGGVNVSEYLLGHVHPLRSVNTGGNVQTMAADSIGNLFAATTYGSDEYLRTFDARTLRVRPGYGPYAGPIAVDRDNYVYVRGYGHITVLNPGGMKKLRVMRKHIDWNGPLAFDRSGKLYVANISAITVFAPTSRLGYMTYERKIASGIESPVALAFGPADELFVANCRRCPYSQPGKRRDWISVYARNGSTPLRRFYDGADGTKQPRALAVDSKGRLYVANYNFDGQGRAHGGAVAVYAPDGSSPTNTITKGIDAPIALAIDPSDNLYVANWFGGSVTVYGSGGTQLLATIKDGVSAPYSLRIGSP